MNYLREAFPYGNKAVYRECRFLRSVKRLLFISNLFPDASEPIRGLDNAMLLHAMAPHFPQGIRALSPRPTKFGRGRAAHLRPRPQDVALMPHYVATPYIPIFGSRWNARLMERALNQPLAEIVREFRPDLLLGSWLYPDGCALAPLANKLELPLVLITQGTDTHQYLDNAIRRQQILHAIDQSSAVICRSKDLALRLLAAGASEDKLKVIYNGVDSSVFHHAEQDKIRAELDLLPSNPMLLFVGNLLPVKNPLFLLEAHAELNRRRFHNGMAPSELVLLGDGPLRLKVQRHAEQLGTATNVHLKGSCPPTTVARWMNAADLLCLCSHNEGFPNVILEAESCGLPVIATDVGGISERVGRTSAGIIVRPKNLAKYVCAIEERLEGAENHRTRSNRIGASGPRDWKVAAEEYRAVLEIVAASKSN